MARPCKTFCRPSENRQEEERKLPMTQSLTKPRTSAKMAMALTLSLLAGPMLAGCAGLPHDKPQLKPREAADLGLTNTAPVPVAADWWQALGDPQLDRIMADALAGNPSLDEAAARLRMAGSLIASARSGLLPQVSADASAMDQRLSNRYIYPAPLGGSWTWISNAQANLDWSLDLAGRQKELVLAAKVYTHANELQLSAARVALAGNVAQAYVNFARAEAQARIAREFVASRSASLRIVTGRRDAGLGNEFDIASARTLQSEAEQALTRALGARALAVHALAALAGRGPDYGANLTTPTLALDKALPVPETLPADLLARRADLLAAREQVKLAMAGEKIAKTEFYPNVNLRAFVGAQALGIGSLFTGSALTGGFGPAIHLPIFSGGAIRAQYRQAVAGADIAIAQYNKAVVGAVREAADALSGVETNRADARQQAEILTGLEKTVSLDKVRLQSGLSTNLDVLSAGERLLSARQAQVDLAADGAVKRIQLLIALGGGFTPIPDQNAGATAPAGK